MHNLSTVLSLSHSSRNWRSSNYAVARHDRRMCVGCSECPVRYGTVWSSATLSGDDSRTPGAARVQMLRDIVYTQYVSHGDRRPPLFNDISHLRRYHGHGCYNASVHLGAEAGEPQPSSSSSSSSPLLHSFPLLLYSFLTHSSPHLPWPFTSLLFILSSFSLPFLPLALPFV